MIEKLRKLAEWTFYPWLLTLYPIVYLFSINLSDVREDEVLEVVIVALVATTILYVVFYLLIHDAHRTGAITGVIALVFLTYGHFYEALDDTDLGQTALMPLMIVLGLVAILLIWRSKTIWRQLTPYLNGIFAVLLAMSLWPVVEYLVDRPPAGATALANPLERVLSTPTLNNSPERPDIYYIILDGYSSNALWMREYGYDNSAFTDALEERGFYVAYDSKSNYGVTLVSMPSSLNMRYITTADEETAREHDLPDEAYLRSLIANNRVAYDLKQLGYSYVYMLSGHIPPSTLADVNITFYPDGPEYFSGSEFVLSGEDGTWAYKQPFWSFFLETTMLRSVASQLVDEDPNRPNALWSPKTMLATFEELEEVPYQEEATFTFAHIDPDYEYYFFEELHFLNARVLELVDHLLARSSVPPIIIFQADHGSLLGSPFSADLSYGNFEILNAFYLPDDGSEDLYPAIPPVNSFRVIFNRYFGGEYLLLESRQYLVPDGRWKGDLFTYIQYVDDGRLNVRLGDQIALLYLEIDDEGRPQFHIYSVTDLGEKGEEMLTIAYESIKPYLSSPPQENTLVLREGPVAFYALTSGEVQFNIGPDSIGREWAVVLDMFPPRVVNGYQVGAE
jgi:hypothetical protein